MSTAYGVIFRSRASRVLLTTSTMKSCSSRYARIGAAVVGDGSMKRSRCTVADASTTCASSAYSSNCMHTKRVLLAHRDSAVQELATRALTSIGVTVDVATSPADALL